jgi:hypothetical protein
LHNDQWVIDEIKEEIKRFLEVKENENTIYQHVWDTAKAVLKEKFIAMSAYIKRTERSQINALSQTHRKIRTSKTQIKQKKRNNKNKGRN